MNQLFNLQNNFQEYLLHANSDIKKDIIATESVSIETRLGIYGDAYCSRLIEALAHNYPALQCYLGEDVFRTLGVAYLKRYPSTYRSIRWFGNHLPIFLREYCLEQPYLAELALIEWTLTIVFDGENADPIGLDIMSTIQPDDWGNIQLTFHPTVQILTLEWDIIPFWKMLSEGQTPTTPGKTTGTTCLFWRKELINQFCSLQADEAIGICLMQNGTTFGELCEELCRLMDEEKAVMRAATLLKSWISSGLIIKVDK